MGASAMMKCIAVPGMDRRIAVTAVTTMKLGLALA